MSAREITFQRLINKQLIEEACALLYQEYIKTDSWFFAADNPSNLRVIEKNNRKLLVDRITPHAKWFGAFDREKLIGCIRIFKATKLIPFEIETYPSASEIVQNYIIPSKPNLFECSRACVNFEYRGRNILNNLYLKVFENCMEEQCSIFGSTSNEHVILLMKRIKWPCLQKNAFKFEETDAAAVNFHLANFQALEVEKIIKNIKLLESIKNRKKTNIIDALTVVAPIFPAPFYWHDTKGRVMGINSLCLKAMNKNLDEVLGKTPYDFYSYELAEHIWKHSLRVLINGETLSQEESVYNNEGEHTGSFLAIKAPIYDEDGTTIGVLGTSIDITLKKEAEKNLILAKEKAEAANRAKTAFVQNMQHDIRTPVTGLWSVLSLLATSETTPEKKEILEMALTASERLLNLCNDVVEFGDLEYNTQPIVEQSLNIYNLIYSVIELNKPAVFTKNLTLRLTIEASVPKLIISDEHRISRILLNLIGNAIKFSHQGEITLSVSTLGQDEDYEDVLIIEISDKGIGIPEEKIDTIFEKFTRGISSNTNQYIGSGLGLYVVKTFTEELGGSISVESRENEGTSFKLRLPFKKQLSTDTIKPKQKAETINALFSSPLNNLCEERNSVSPGFGIEQSNIKKTAALEILIIEDDKVCLFAIKKLLGGYAKTLDSAENITQALKQLSAKKYGLIISDLGLPDGSGNDIVRKIKSDPNHLNYSSPFVAVSAHSDAMTHKMAENAGFSHITSKPLTIEKIIQFL